MSFNSKSKLSQGLIPQILIFHVQLKIFDITPSMDILLLILVTLLLLHHYNIYLLMSITMQKAVVDLRFQANVTFAYCDGIFANSLQS